MKTLSSLLLLGILILWAELPPAVLEEKSGEDKHDSPLYTYGYSHPHTLNTISQEDILIAGKAGICPIYHCYCIGPLPNKCRNDFSCKGRQKCCEFCCAKRCLDPVKGTWQIKTPFFFAYGRCGYINPVLCFTEFFSHSCPSFTRRPEINYNAGRESRATLFLWQVYLHTNP
ncbi:WAP four-disulfide core domain protein 5-like [Rhineura floridana]|uniref:WAP four-disulfide core domain protein 5-like n=1 Tax=Rhineura floridana TaxID=261503 RepID=UPI002AC891AD|nr:WAP four-disulfide core domain protein 5-like [Rhineura floridana]